MFEPIKCSIKGRLALIRAMGAEDGKSASKKKFSPMLAWLKRACDLGSEKYHCNSERWCVKFSSFWGKIFLGSSEYLWISVR
jgi:hypothetical protein